MLLVEQSKIVVDDVIEAVGKVVLKVIVVFAVVVHPFAAVTITEYVPAELTVLVADVVPSFHK
jgi:hypothetical protein